MVGHLHWGVIKHIKGKSDKIRFNIIYSHSRKIYGAAAHGYIDPVLNPR